MRLSLILPPVQPEVYLAVETCSYAGCGRTFRVYPEGVSHDQTSARLKGVAVMFSALDGAAEFFAHSFT